MNLEEKEQMERLIALSAVVARYQMALEAAAACIYVSDTEAIVQKALAKP